MTVTLSVLADPEQRGGEQIITVTQTTAAEPEIKLGVPEINKVIFLMSFASKKDTCATTQPVLLQFVR